MGHAGKYLYCIIPCSQERTFEGVAPVGDAAGVVHTVPYDGLAAVVSDSPASRYESTRANMVAHQKVQERVMQEFTLLPVRFCTITQDFASAVTDIRRLLEKRGGEFHRLLSEIEGMVEVGLKVLWQDQKAVFQEIVGQNAAIHRLRDSLAGRPAQAAHFDRMHLGEKVKEALERKRHAEATSILAPLRGLAQRTVESEVTVDRMLMNASFLVAEERQAEFDAAVAELDRQWGHRATFRYVGPVPLYNFVSIVVHWEEL